MYSNNISFNINKLNLKEMNRMYQGLLLNIAIKYILKISIDFHISYKFVKY